MAAHAALSEALACTDADGDGYFAEEGCGALLDCDDEDSRIHPAACDVKLDGIDQDCDGADRSRGRACRANGCGLGIELIALLPALPWLHRRRDLRSAKRHGRPSIPPS